MVYWCVYFRRCNPGPIGTSKHFTRRDTIRALIYDGPERLNWTEVEAPTISETTDALVEPVAVAICDIDGLIAKGLSPFAPPFPIGHECVARVAEVGSGVTSFAIDDLVIVPFQISCGTCSACVVGFTAHCKSVAHKTAGYGFGAASGNYGGMISDLVRVPYADHMLVRIPDSLDPISLASCCDNIADGWRTVGPYLEQAPGASVLIVGGGLRSIGLYAAACAIACGAERVEYVDHDETRLTIASTLGAHAVKGFQRKPKPAFPITVDASGNAAGLDYAALSTEREGHLFSASMFFGEPPQLPLYPLYMRGFRFRTGRVHSRTVIPTVLNLIETERLNPNPVTSRVVGWEHAAEAILEGTPSKLVIKRF